MDYRYDPSKIDSVHTMVEKQMTLLGANWPQREKLQRERCGLCICTVVAFRAERRTVEVC